MLYIDLGGRIACHRHLGHEGRAALTADPSADELVTPLTVWTRFTPGAFGPEQGLVCEDCPVVPPVAVGRRESDPCELGTPGCSVLHSACPVGSEAEATCATW